MWTCSSKVTAVERRRELQASWHLVRGPSEPPGSSCAELSPPFRLNATVTGGAPGPLPGCPTRDVPAVPSEEADTNTQGPGTPSREGTSGATPTVKPPAFTGQRKKSFAWPCRVRDTSALKRVSSEAAGAGVGSRPQMWQECNFLGFSTTKSSLDVKRVRRRRRERHFRPTGRLCPLMCPRPGALLTSRELSEGSMALSSLQVTLLSGLQRVTDASHPRLHVWSGPWAPCEGRAFCSLLQQGCPFCPEGKAISGLLLLSAGHAEAKAEAYSAPTPPGWVPQDPPALGLSYPLGGGGVTTSHPLDLAQLRYHAVPGDTANRTLLEGSALGESISLSALWGQLPRPLCCNTAVFRGCFCGGTEAPAASGTATSWWSGVITSASGEGGDY